MFHSRLSTSSNLLRAAAVRSFSVPAKPPIRWGILSAGKISSDFTQAVHLSEGAQPLAVAARNEDKARDFATRLEIPKFYSSYDDLLADPEVDVVYVGSVADQHAKLTTKSLLAGKPTVVEKPLGLSYNETKSLVDLARSSGVFLMEGLWTRCFPAMRLVREWIGAGEIGDVVAVQGDFGWSTADCGPDDRIWHPTAGGMTLDIGMYLAHLGQVAFPHQDVDRIQTLASCKNGVDHTAMTNIQYEDGGFLQYYVTGRANTEERVVIQGTKGRIVIEPPAHVPETVKLFKTIGRGQDEEVVRNFPLPTSEKYTHWNYPGSIGFVHEIQSVGQALQEGLKEVPHFTLDDSLQMASTLDTILAQAHEVDEDDAEPKLA